MRLDAKRMREQTQHADRNLKRTVDKIKAKAHIYEQYTKPVYEMVSQPLSSSIRPVESAGFKSRIGSYGKMSFGDVPRAAPKTGRNSP